MNRNLVKLKKMETRRHRKKLDGFPEGQEQESPWVSGRHKGAV